MRKLWLWDGAGFAFYIAWRVLRRVLKLTLLILALPFIVAGAIPFLFLMALIDEAVTWWKRVRADWEHRA
jgi:hypothetical protein